MGNGLTINFKFGSGLKVLMVTQPLTLALSKHWVAWPLVECEHPRTCVLLVAHWPCAIGRSRGSVSPFFYQTQSDSGECHCCDPLEFGERNWPWCGLSHCLYRGVKRIALLLSQACKTAVAPPLPSLSAGVWYLGKASWNSGQAA